LALVQEWTFSFNRCSPRWRPDRIHPRSCDDVAPDGQRFYGKQLRTPPPPPVVTHINLIENWFEELKAKVPVPR
jgi:hypothetical protein